MTEEDTPREDNVAHQVRLERLHEKTDIRLDTVISPYRAVIKPLLKYIDAIDEGDPCRPVVQVLAEFVPRHWCEAILHNQTALRMKLRLFVRPNTVVVDVPFHLADGAADAEA